MEVIKGRISDVTLPQLLGLLELLDVLVAKFGANFHRALVDQSLPILLLQVGSYLLPEILEITFLQTQGESEEVVSHLKTWANDMNKDCFESLISQILPEGVLHVNPTADLVY